MNGEPRSEWAPPGEEFWKDGIYDRAGEPITMARWQELFHTDYQRVALDNVGSYEVSTVWLGFTHLSMQARAPVAYFETAIFDPDGECQVIRRWDSEDEALEGHAATVASLSEPGDG